MRSTLSLWARISVLAGCLVLGSLCWNIVSSWGSPANQGHLDIDQHVDFGVPQPHYSPAEVVALQIESIRDSAVSLDRLATCYSLASPENRAVTGPFKRFADMLMKPPYDRLAGCQTWQVGRAVVKQNYAGVLVSTLSSDGSGAAFRFILQYHPESPYGGCWLTEGVQVLGMTDSSDAALVPKKESSLE